LGGREGSRRENYTGGMKKKLIEERQRGGGEFSDGLEEGGVGSRPVEGIG